MSGQVVWDIYRQAFVERRPNEPDLILSIIDSAVSRPGEVCLRRADGQQEWLEVPTNALNNRNKLNPESLYEECLACQGDGSQIGSCDSDVSSAGPALPSYECLQADLAFTSADRDRWAALAAKLASEKDELAGSSREIIAEQMDRITTIKDQLKGWKARALLAEFELNRRNASLLTALGRHPR